MKVLIVDDDLPLAESTAELLRCFDNRKQELEAISLAADLETAISHLPVHDAVLCDGIFPPSPHSSFQAENWLVLRHAAQVRGIHFVLYSGSDDAVECAREWGIFALTKPATIEEIYSALTHYSSPNCAETP